MSAQRSISDHTSKRRADLRVAKRFAKLLDADPFLEAQRCLATRCRYHFRGSIILGAKKIMDVYRHNSAKGRRVLDELRFESKIEGHVGNRIRILYTDHLKVGNLRHKHQCRQDVRIVDGKIEEIRHKDLRSESRALKRFFREAGIDWK